MSDSNTRRYLTLRDAAEQAEISYSQALRDAQSGKLEAQQVEGRWQVTKLALRRWLRDRRSSANLKARRPTEENAHQSALKAITDQARAELEESRRRDLTPLSVEEIRRLTDEDIHDRLVGRFFTVLSSDIESLKRQDPVLRAWYTTKHFEADVMNGGLDQFFRNTDEAGESYWELVVEGYATLGLEDVRSLIEDEILPAARMAKKFRAQIDNAEDDYPEADLEQFDGLIKDYDDLRNQVVRDHPETFAI